LKYLFPARTLILGLLLTTAVCAAPDNPPEAKILPDRIGDFRAFPGIRGDLIPGEAKSYRSANGDELLIELKNESSDAAAYASLTGFRSGERKTPTVFERCDASVACYASDGEILFVKGKVFVAILGTAKHSDRVALARLIADPIDAGEKDIPALVRHLPEWQTAQDSAIYAVDAAGLQAAAGHEPLLADINFEGGTEAVTAPYGQSRLAIVEFDTPQIAAAADARMKTRIEELRASGQTVPTGYRRVGNYSVFVFGGDEGTATQLINQVHYEKSVQWLGQNPRLFELAQKRYTETTANVIVSVLEASGLSLIICLGVGGAFGAVIFRRRRAQQARATAYSDAGGMVRLNLDKMSASDTAMSPRLLGPGEG
jgi:hypothetical protein